jgi:hypothetical protein
MKHSPEEIAEHIAHYFGLDAEDVLKVIKLMDKEK